LVYQFAENIILGGMKLLKEINTQRILLREIEEKDLYNIYEYASDEDVARYMPWETHKSLDDTHNFIDTEIEKYKTNTSLNYAIVLKENNKMIGTAGCFEYKDGDKFAQGGYVINKKYWGMGLVPEAMKAIIEYLFNEKDVHRVYAKHYVGNEKSGRVMQKLGMKFEGTMEDSVFVKGKYITTKHYAIINPYSNE